MGGDSREVRTRGGHYAKNDLLSRASVAAGRRREGRVERMDRAVDSASVYSYHILFHQRLNQGS